MEFVIAAVSFTVGFLTAWCVQGGGEVHASHGAAGDVANLDPKPDTEPDSKRDFAPDAIDPHLTVAEARLKAEAEAAREERRARENAARKEDENAEVASGKARRDEKLGVVYDSEPDDADDLTKIKGVAAVLNGKLNAFGVYKYQQIASWTPQNVAEFAERLSFKDRIAHEDWISQARDLQKEKYG